MAVTFDKRLDHLETVAEITARASSPDPIEDYGQTMFQMGYLKAKQEMINLSLGLKKRKGRAS